MFKTLIRQRDYLFLLLIVVVNLILRLWRLEELFHFTYDESVFAFIGKRMFINGHIPLIGGVTPFHVHLSPFFYWLSGLILFVSNLNPLGWGVAAAIISFLTIILLFFLTKEVFSARIALLSIVIYSFSVLINIDDRHYWGLTFNPLISLVILYSLFKIIKAQKIYFFPLALALGFAFHTDPSTLVFFPLIALTFIKFKISLKNRYFLVSLLIFLLSFLPLAIFDLRHNFVNIKSVFQYVPETKASTGFSASRLLNSFELIPGLLARIIYLPKNTDLAKEYSYCQVYVEEKLQDVSLFLLFSAVIILLFGIFRKSKNKHDKVTKFVFNFLLLSVFLGVLIYKGLLGRPFFEHYLSTLIPLLVIFTALFIERILNAAKFIGVILVSLFVLINFTNLTYVYHSYGFKIETSAVKWAISNTKTDFSLESLSACFRYNGYRYLFMLYGKEPTKSFVDQNFFWLYDKLPANNHPELIVIIVADDYDKNELLKEKYKLYKEREIKSKKFGSLEVIIADNTKGIFYDF